MNTTAQIAKHFRDAHFGGNWTAVNLRDVLADVTWQEATKKLYSLNSIAILVYHLHYYVVAVMGVLEGEPLTAKDQYSFDLPPLQSQEDWERLLSETWTDAERFAGLVEQLPASKLEETFVDEKYGNWYRNLIGITEHVHYHLGQIVLLKKILRQTEETDKVIMTV